MARVGDRQPLELFDDPRFLAHAGGVDQADRVGRAVAGIGPDPVDRDRIAGDAGFGAGEQPVLAEHAIDQGRFAGIGTADDGELERAGRRILIVVQFDRLQVIEVGLQCLEQVAHALAVFGRQRHRLAEAERERLDQPGFARAALCLVGDEHHRRWAGAQPAGDFLVERSHPGAGVDDEQRDIGPGERGLGLRAHPPGQAGRVLVLPAGGVDHGELQADQFRFAEAPVAGYAGLVIDQRQLLADEPVEQRRLADIGPADDDDLGKHGRGQVAVRRRLGKRNGKFLPPG